LSSSKKAKAVSDEDDKTNENKKKYTFEHHNQFYLFAMGISSKEMGFCHLKADEKGFM
jgi:hypothetical protein